MPQVAKTPAILDQESKIKSVKKLLNKMQRQLEVLRKRNKADREKERRNKNGRDLNRETAVLREAIQGQVDDFGESSGEEGLPDDNVGGSRASRPAS